MTPEIHNVTGYPNNTIYLKYSNSIIGAVCLLLCEVSMGEEIPETEPVPAPPGCDAVNCACWPAGETPTYVLLAFSGIRKCSDDSLWDAMNQDFVLLHTGIACEWELLFNGYKVQLLYWDHGFPPLQMWERVSNDGIFKADMANCTETGTWANMWQIGDCGVTVDGYGGFVSMFFGECP